MADLSELGTEIGNRRRLLKLSQAELTRRAHVSRATLDALENQRIGEIGFAKLSRILAALDLELKLQAVGQRRPTLEDLRAEGRDDQGLDRRR
jgi:HTH-type transcriptional regulator/antitoxin HipB